MSMEHHQDRLFSVSGGWVRPHGMLEDIRLRPLIFFLACLALMLGCGSDSTVLLARLALCALSDNGGIATYYLVDLFDLILGITLVYLI